MTQLSPITGFRRLLYLVTPNETSFGKLSEVPHYVAESYPWFFVAIVLEFVVAIIRRRRVFRINDSISSLSAGVISQTPMLFFRSVEMGVYVYIYNNWRFYDYHWQNPLVWWACFVGVDFFYYWLHRMSHEWNFFWAAHQVHHSSEDYNMTTALRQSLVQRYIGWLFYVPMAFIGLPATLFVAHIQFNLIYQFWIHTQVVGRLGPLEWIINTPSHHRVHHGRNRYCIDKNYGGTLIIWDRMFGTFAAEKDDEPIAYGLVHPVATWDPFWIQMHSYIYIAQRVWSISGWRNKLSVIFQGPGWDVGKPRLGLIEDIPDIRGPQSVYDRKPTAGWVNVYILVHFALLIGAVTFVTNELKKITPTYHMLIMNVFIVYSLTCMGALLDCRKLAPLLEALRCGAFVFVSWCYLPNAHFAITDSSSWQLPKEAPYVPHVLLYWLHVVFALSMLPWILHLVGFWRLSAKDSKVE